MKSVVYYHQDFAEKGYITLKHRVKPGFDALAELVRGGSIKIVSPVIDQETENLLTATHVPIHIERVKAEGYHDVALLSAAGVVQASSDLASGLYEFAFCFVGTAGHHASRGDSWGFCYYNDAAMAVTKLRSMGLCRIMIIDLDPHFGDGTRNILGLDKDIIHINFHEDDNQFLHNPHLNNYDFGIDGADDKLFLNTLDTVIQGEWDYEFLIVIFGHDSHCLDYGNFFLTDSTYVTMAQSIKAFASGKPVLFILSGGSNPQVASKIIPSIIQIFSEP
ncbi:MAG: histone deacetylase [Acidobacteriota bacterium]